MMRNVYHSMASNAAGAYKSGMSMINQAKPGVRGFGQSIYANRRSIARGAAMGLIAGGAASFAMGGTVGAGVMGSIYGGMGAAALMSGSVGGLGAARKMMRGHPTMKNHRKVARGMSRAMSSVPAGLAVGGVTGVQYGMSTRNRKNRSRGYNRNRGHRF